MNGRTIAQQKTAIPTLVPARSGLLQRQCACGGTPGLDGECAACRAKRLGVQRLPLSSKERGSEGEVAPPIVHEALQSPGHPLDAATRAFMEPRFGHDFSRVRVHTDTKAAESAQAVNAQAYTVGHDIVFGAGQYAPGMTAGQRLLAHELTHTVQQQQAISISPSMSAVNDHQEREAERLADSILTDQVLPINSTRSRVPNLQRSSNSSEGSSGSASSGSSGGGTAGGAWPTPTPDPAGGCQCRLDICWRPIQLWYVPSYFKHGFINIIDSRCQLHNLYVDPGLHGGHSHAIDSTPGWDTSGETCLGFPYPCTLVDRLAPAIARYEALDVAYDATSGPNSNAVLEWILHEAGIRGIRAPHPGLQAWSYYQDHPAQRSSPPRFHRTPVAPTPVPAGATP